MILPGLEKFRQVGGLNQRVSPVHRFDPDIAVDFGLHHVLGHVQEMPGLETAYGNRQIGMDTGFRHAAVAVQPAVDIHRDHTGAAPVDCFDGFPCRTPDFAMKAGTEKAVHDGAVFRQVQGSVPGQGRDAGFFAQAVIICAVFGKLFGKQDQDTGDFCVMQQLRDDVSVSCVVAAAAEDGHRRLPVHAAEDGLAGPEHQLPARGSGGDGCRVAIPHVLHRQDPDHDTVLFSFKALIAGLLRTGSG